MVRSIDPSLPPLQVTLTCVVDKDPLHSALTAEIVIKKGTMVMNKTFRLRAKGLTENTFFLFEECSITFGLCGKMVYVDFFQF